VKNHGMDGAGYVSELKYYGQFQLRGSVYNEAFLHRVKHWVRAIYQKNWALPSCLGSPTNTSVGRVVETSGGCSTVEMNLLQPALCY
jgi:hypothetical protein